jgi:hypothetical protein
VYSQAYTTPSTSQNNGPAAVQFLNLAVQQQQAQGAGHPFPPIPPIPGFEPAAASLLASPRLTLSGPPDKLRLNWGTESGIRYQVQVSPDLKNWTNVGTARSSTGAGDSLGIDLGTGNAFYRLIKLP